MTIPSYDTFFRPFLSLLASSPPLHMRDVQEKLQSSSGLSAEELSQRLPSGKSFVIENRIGWARTYLYKSALIERVARGTYGISEAGRRMLSDHPARITLADLHTTPAFSLWIKKCKVRNVDLGSEVATPLQNSPETILEMMLQSERELRSLVEEDLRERLTEIKPSHFEWLVEQLVVKLGYGSSADAVMAALRSGSGDTGIDGVIQEDRLGLGQIYLQAKRWKGNVGRPEIQAFVGAMHGRAQKGVFITTSDYTREAREYAESLQGIRIRLVDGRELAALMIDTGLGVNEERVFRTYRIDNDFFEDDD